MSFWSSALAAIVFVWSLFKVWIYAAVVSFTNKETIWIIVPIWLSWFFAEFFQEKEGTSFGNAISNGVVPFWVGIDWTRQLTSQISLAHVKFNALFFGKYAISGFVMLYGLFIIILGIKGKEFIRYFGRIREVSYILAALTPFIYGLIEPSYKYFLAIIVFFPFFYWVIEIFDRMTPEPAVVTKDKGIGGGAGGQDFGGFDNFNQMPDNEQLSGGGMEDFSKIPPLR